MRVLCRVRFCSSCLFASLSSLHPSRLAHSPPFGWMRHALRACAQMRAYSSPTLSVAFYHKKCQSTHMSRLFFIFAGNLCHNLSTFVLRIARRSHIFRVDIWTCVQHLADAVVAHALYVAVFYGSAVSYTQVVVYGSATWIVGDAKRSESAFCCEFFSY